MNCKNYMLNLFLAFLKKINYLALFWLKIIKFIVFFAYVSYNLLALEGYLKSYLGKNVAFASVAQLDRASVFGTEGLRFESVQMHQNPNINGRFSDLNISR